ncbi:MAG TPA: CopG family transcriptional regulator [Vicinamibacterales bacterium]|jgi:predicted transcriptional regulator
MKRTTLFIPEDLERDLQAFARREGKPVAWFVREALTEYVAERRQATRLPSFAGIAAGDATDVAERHEALLWAQPHDEPPTTARRAPARRKRR